MDSPEINRPWIIDFDCQSDPRKGIHIKHITSGNDGDVCNSCVTYELLRGTDHKYCIDIGVDEGWWSFFAASCNPNCKIDAFEPNPISYKSLLPYLADQKQVQLYNLGISDTCGVLPFTIAGGESHSRLHTNSIKVSCITIDKFIINRLVNLIKIDTEGHDIIILRSLHPYLEQIKSIIFECTSYWSGLQATIDELFYLRSHYEYMYILSRRGDPLLHKLTDDLITQFVNYSYENRYQVDILVCHTPIQTIPVKPFPLKPL